MEHPERNPLNYEYIREQQQADDQLLKLQRKYPNNYINKCLDDNVDDIICYVKDHNNPYEIWKIALPDQMVKPTIKWFQEVMGHPGQSRLNETLRQRYYHHKLRYFIDRFKCEHCQRHKLPGKGYGLLPEREIKIAPWEEVAIDLVGPWDIKVNGRTVQFNALTCIDTASNLVELIRIDNKSSEHIRNKFMQSWLTRYPRPMRVVHDKGGEFIGSAFQWLLTMFSLKDVQSTTKNPQSNSICERMHQTVENILRTNLYSRPPVNMTQAKDIVDQALSQAMHATRTTVMTTIGSTPGSLAFSRDMFLNIPLIADWQAIAKQREQRINDDLRRANLKRRQFDYCSGEKVLKRVHHPTKLGVRTSGPYPIERVHVNGTLTILLRPGVTERINIRRLQPYR
jgi:transposase InsO family protein